MNRALLSLPLLILAQLLALGCSELGKQQLADDLAELTRGEVAVSVAMPKAIASKVGFQAEHSQPTDEAFVMAGDGQLNAQQVKTVVVHLAWPQSYEAIYGKLGNPARRDDQADYYVMPNGHQMTIYYDAQGIATGYSLGDSGE
ncbi:MAG: hypothetical protein AAF921_14025 [Cyanobacteria bacterium P01_D01_bin.44]